MNTDKIKSVLLTIGQILLGLLILAGYIIIVINIPYNNPNDSIGKFGITFIFTTSLIFISVLLGFLLKLIYNLNYEHIQYKKRLSLIQKIIRHRKMMLQAKANQPSDSIIREALIQLFDKEIED